MRTDIEMANAIVANYRKTKGAWVGSHLELDKNVAFAVAQGIALGRQEGLELARLLIVTEIEKKNA